MRNPGIRASTSSRTNQPKPPMKPQEHPHSEAADLSGDEADAREFEAFAREQDPLDIEAATWTIRRRAGLDAAGKTRLQAWLDADPRHADALAGMDAVRDGFGGLSNKEIASLRAAAEHAADHPVQPAVCQPGAAHTPGPPGLCPPPRPESWTGRKWWLNWLPQAVAACAVLAILGGSWLAWQTWQAQPTFKRGYSTARGETLRVTLPDAATLGSTIQMDAATRLTARLYRDHREVTLDDGQAMFIVHADRHRPFHILAGGMRITVVGTRFSVRHTALGMDAGQTVVAVEQGHVRVARDTQNTGGTTGDPLSRTVDLTAGQTVMATADGRLGEVRTISPSTVATWREQRLSFDQTPLAQAIAEFGRYVDTGLVVHDPTVAALPVGGSYSLTQFQHFTETLPKVLPVRLVRRGKVTEVVQAQP